MKPFIQITLPTGQTYEINTAVIAGHRAAAMCMEPGKFPDLDAAMAETLEVFEDDGEVITWAQNQMVPADYMGSARLVRFAPPEPDYKAATWVLSEHKALLGEIEASMIMASPVEHVLTIMAASRQLCNVTVLNDEDGAPYAALALIIGPPNVLGAYINTLDFTGRQITGEQAPALPN